MAISGHNGNNETRIGLSNSIGLTVYDSKNNEIPITDSSIYVVIQRDSNLPEISYKYINATQFQLSSGFLPNAFNITSTNASIHIELKPINESIGYLIALKFGSSPIINKTYSSYDAFKLICRSKYFCNSNCFSGRMKECKKVV
jgi:hypothetical protein